MEFKEIELSRISVNEDNDRHGLEVDEDAAILWLFENHGQHMRNLAADIVDQNGILNVPLVKARGEGFVVYDGNRRVTCLKLLADPSKCPTPHRTFFSELAGRSGFTPLSKIYCQVESSQTTIDTTIGRRHNGSDSGRGQLKWDLRAKANHANRIGGTKQYPIAEAVENFLDQQGYPSPKKNRSINALSADQYQKTASKIWN